MSQYNTSVSGQGNVPTTFATISGNAVPAANIITFTGVGGIAFSGAGSTVTATFTPSGTLATSYTTNSGTAIPSGNVLQIVGAGIVSTSGAGNTVTITAAASIFPWTDKAVSFNAASNNGYFCTAALTITLPVAPTQGQVVIIEADTGNAVIVKANAGQIIRLGSPASSLAGSATSSKQGDSMYLVFRTATSTWNSISTEGTWMLA